MLSIGERKGFLSIGYWSKSTVFVPGGTVIKVFSFDPERCTVLMYVSTEANLLSKIRIA